MARFARVKDDPQPEVEVVRPRPRRLADSPDGAPCPRSLDDHREFLLGHVHSLHPLGIGLLDASGLAICETIVADLDLPTFTSATVDGWALRASNLVGAAPTLPVILPVVDEIPAGGYRGAPLAKGTAVRVAAGAPVPEGADAVVALEDGLAVGDEVQFVSEARFRQNLCLAGSQIADGTELVAKDSVLTPRLLGLIAEVGHDKVLARPRPRVVVLTADASLVEPGLPLTRLGESYDACTTMLAAAARRDGAQVFPAGIVTSEPKPLATTLQEQLVRADLVLLVTEVDDRLEEVFGAEDAIDVAEVDGLPGRSLFALIGPEHSPVLVLPPGAVPAHLAYVLLGRPLVQRLAGVPGADTAVREETLIEPVAADPGRTRLVLGRFTADGVEPLDVDQPGTVDLAAADALIVVPPAAAPLPAGAGVACRPLD
jgi:molybdopterin molybdotransferase